MAAVGVIVRTPVLVAEGSLAHEAVGPKYSHVTIAGFAPMTDSKRWGSRL